MKKSTKNLLIGYGVFCVANIAIGYFWARKQEPGKSPLADLNSSLLRLNVLAYVLPESTGPEIPALPLAQLPAPAGAAPDWGITSPNTNW